MKRLTLAVLLASAAPASEPSLAPGQYIITTGGYGTLIVGPPKGGKQSFEISVVGGNAHTCSLDGDISGTVAKVEGESDDKPCVIEFSPAPDGVNVTPQKGSCRSYCGVRASFEGHYVRPAPECLPKKVRASRDAAKRLYDRKDYEGSREILFTLLDQCGPVIERFDQMWIRCDLAIALHHLEDDARCVSVLEPLHDLIQADDEEVGQGEPAYRDALLKIARAARHNLKTCMTPRH